MSNQLTETQEAILEFMVRHQREQLRPPSLREISDKFGFASPNAARKHVQALAAKGLVKDTGDGRSWAAKVNAVQGQLFEAPVYGTIPAGIPAMREQEPDETVAFDPAIFGVKNPKPNQFWVLRVSGDSMTGAGIQNDDLVALVRRDPKPGDIIAALVDENSVTLKRFVKEKGRTVLRAANPKYADIIARKIECQGVMVGLIRQKID